MKKRSIIKLSAFCLLFVMIFGFCFTACSQKKPVKISEISFDELSKSIEIGKYTGCSIKMLDDGNEASILSYLDSQVKIKSYPDGAVEYYLEQLKKQYQYYADQAGMSYEDMLKELGEDSVTMKAKAEKLVKQDMIFSYIQRKENITLSDEEKSKYFDRYVAKYSEAYNYAESYVREKLSELVYESMLYDKTVEYLIINNTFVENIVSEQ